MKKFAKIEAMDDNDRSATKIETEDNVAPSRKGFFVGFAAVLWGLSVFWVLFAFVSYFAGEGLTGVIMNTLTALLTAVIGFLVFRQGKVKRNVNDIVEEDTEEGA